jgi:hypothetical protein
MFFKKEQKKQEDNVETIPHWILAIMAPKSVSLREIVLRCFYTANKNQYTDQLIECLSNIIRDRTFYNLSEDTVQKILTETVPLAFADAQLKFILPQNQIKHNVSPEHMDQVYKALMKMIMNSATPLSSGEVKNFISRNQLTISHTTQKEQSA